ncbi:protein-L-isoaspartate(D-aspartate) O-methyltransferase [Blastopirellula sp. JC732]|uniref:Protein-L-isoaspartate O-methyltransferase n=1 Tax=Blastopirellula sediminis TaxID=2894196 RepID=A0A9X1MSE9_9BACT|nr:protein-L-isoaspartate(D-aspartate) O-methyltransferase [Blastopirellula sediminis]MCC9605065.1 protein-L-isoaspartate(D-aspartate) O-methyltransferase [Blastopirellula sediminis]MCC9631635.1 protein-L-isoaspartate(D-aspartate) O-methyltransferase [Blastopirellula sediminis]
MLRPAFALLTPLLVCWLTCSVVAEDPAAAARRHMVEEAVIANGVSDQRVIQAMMDTPRHEFVAYKYRSQAYYDMALPIGGQQTISSPFIVAYMTESLEPQPEDKVLEIGTGSGFQAAVLSPLVKDVYSIEIVPELGRSASRTLRRLGYNNVHTKIGDGYQGWAEHAPFDKIIVTCSPEKPPQPLIDQLREGGRMVIPVGERYQQVLYLFTKKDGKLVSEALRPTLFVPMTGKAEDNREVKPDPLHPHAANGDFEADLQEHGQMAGWYYQRLFELVEADDAPQGKRYVRFQNSDLGRTSMALQGFGVDGEKVHKLRITAWVKTKDIGLGPDRREAPMIAVTFYDAARRDVGRGVVGPFLADSDWKQIDETVRVPPAAREALLRIGLFGSTGEACFDDVKMTPLTD